MPRDPRRVSRPPSPKQRAARDRNWRVWKLRGLYWNSHPMAGEYLIAYRAAIDAQLAALGAEPETQRSERLRHAAERYQRFRSKLTGNILI